MGFLPLARAPRAKRNSWFLGLVVRPSYHGGGEGLLLPAVGRVPRVDQGCGVQVPI